MGVISCLVFTALTIVVFSKIKNPDKQTARTKYQRKDENHSFNQARALDEDSASNLSDIVYNNQAINLKFNSNNNFHTANNNPNEFYTSKQIRSLIKNNPFSTKLYN